MPINFSNVSFDNPLFLKNDKKIQKRKLSFKGKDKNELPVTPSNESVSNYASVQIHPAFALNMQLLKDGYTKKEIEKHKLFKEINIDGSIFDHENLLDDVMDKKITKKDIFFEKSKEIKDAQAMQRVYFALKEKFNTQDVQQHIFEENQMYNEFTRVLEGLGKDLGDMKPVTCKDKILSVLHYVNCENEPLVYELLNDKKFNNVYLQTALLGVNISKDPISALKVIKMAQDIGYEKDFSFALAVLVGEANEMNLPMIEKMLYEQKFLTENDEFVSTRLMNFLRSAGYGLAKDYVESDEITLDIVQELFEMQQGEQD